MLIDFIFGWCGSVPISVLIAYLIRHGRPPIPDPEPWPILFTNVLAGLVAVGANAGGFRGTTEFAAVMLPIALGVVTAGVAGVAMMSMGRGAKTAIA
jgi:hypothetical protein